jgi:hypothetical protein
MFMRNRRQPRLITGDVWGCLRYLTESSRLASERKRQALSYLEQAFEFHEAAANPHLGARPLLYYYSFLNAAKAFLVIRGVNLPPKTRHGIEDPRANTRQRLRLEGQRVKVWQADSGHENILAAFVQQLDGDASKNREYQFLDTLLAQVPAIHRAYVTARRRSPHFCPIHRFLLLSDGRSVWARAELKTDDRDVESTLQGLCARRAFAQVLTRVAAPRGKAWFETSPVPGHRRGVDPAVARLAGDVRGAGVWTVLTASGYRFYFADFSPRNRLPQLGSILAAMFYLGSITRYKPYDFDRIVSGRYAWLVSEFLATQPEQFLYILASTIAGVDVVRPFAIQTLR